jgi:predicted acylesterase/phospholipase RssA
MTVAFVHSGGASLGTIQVGMAKALIERDVRPDVVVGTCVGALDLRPRHIYVFPTGEPRQLTAPPRGALGMLIHATSLLVAQRFVGEATALNGSRVTILPPPCPIRVQPTDFDHAQDLIARAHNSAAAFLDGERGRVVALSHARRRRRRSPTTGDASELPTAG